MADNASAGGASLDSHDHLSLEQKLEHLAQCGLILSEPFGVEELLSSWDREEWEQPGYEMVLFGLGMTEEQEPWRQHCDSFLAFDVECIEDEDSYQAILDKIAALTKGDLVFTDYMEEVDWDGGKSHLSFKCNGQPVEIEFDQEDDWFSEKVYEAVVSLLDHVDSRRKFFTHDTGDQNHEIGCLFPEQIEQLHMLGIEATIL